MIWKKYISSSEEKAGRIPVSFQGRRMEMRSEISWGCGFYAKRKEKKNLLMNQTPQDAVHTLVFFFVVVFFPEQAGKTVISIYNWGGKKKKTEKKQKPRPEDEKKQSGGIRRSPGFQKRNTDGS